MANTAAHPEVTPEDLRTLLKDGGELALLDVREQGVFVRRHLLLACSCPASWLELKLPLLVPRKTARVVLCDDGSSGLGQRTAQRMGDLGYTDIRVLKGGVEEWEAAGFELYSGFNVPSKALAEFVEEEYHTPSIDAQTLKGMMDRGEDVKVLDSRPMPEFQRRNIPTGICVPGAELAYRVHDIAPDPSTTLVINCGGRTRSIIGAQSLINAGIKNKVYDLRDGTMGWGLAGYSLEHRQERKFPAISDSGLEAARQVMERVSKRFQVQYIDRETLQQWQQEVDSHTLCMLDVRNPEEYEAGHLPGSYSAPRSEEHTSELQSRGAE